MVCHLIIQKEVDELLANFATEPSTGSAVFVPKHTDGS